MGEEPDDDRDQARGRTIRDHTQLTELVGLAYEVAHREARHRLRGAPPVAHRESPSDLAQSAVREVLRDADRLEDRGPTAMRALIKQIVTNKIHEKLRFYGAQQRSQKNEVRWSECPDHALGKSADPAARIAEQEAAGEGMRLLERLSAREAEVVEMRLRGMSHRDIATQLGISEDSSMKILSRARSRLESLRDGQD